MFKLPLFIFLLISSFVLETNDFKVTLPVEPYFQVIDVNIGNEQVPLNIYLVEKDYCFYAISYADYPNSVNLEDRELFFKGVINGMVTNYKGVLVSEKDCEVNLLFSKKDFIIKLPDENYIHVNAYLKERTLYQLIIKTNTKDIKSKEEVEFFTSFELK